MKQRNLFDVSVFSSPKIPPLDEDRDLEEQHDTTDSITQFPVTESQVSFHFFFNVVVPVEF